MSSSHNDRRLVRDTPASTGQSIATLNGRALLSNQGIPLDLDWVQEVRVNTSAVERRAQSAVARRTVKKDWQAAWLLRAITCMDLTTLSGDDTDERVRRLCAKARHPLQQELVQKLGIEELESRSARFAFITRSSRPRCRRWREAGFTWRPSRLDFPRGCRRWPNAWRKFGGRWKRERMRSTSSSRAAHVFGGRWQALYDEVAAFKQACGAAHMKVILGTGDLLTLRNVARASFVAMMAGADFIKTSTGKEAMNATLPVGLVMVRAIREYAQQTGMAVGFKPAGGIRTAKQSIDWLALMKEELGLSWMRAELFRFGASGMLGDIERQLEHHATGRYSAEYRHPIA